MIFQLMTASEDFSFTDNAAMKWEICSNCSVQDSWITFYNTHYELEYEPSLVVCYNFKFT